MATTSFQFKDKEGPYNYVSELATLLRDYAPQQVLQANVPNDERRTSKNLFVCFLFIDLKN